MTAVAVAKSERASWANALAAATVDTVTFAGDRSVVRVTNDTGSDVIWITDDGSTPVANGPKCYRVPASAGASIDIYPEVDTVVVKLICASIQTYSIEGVA